MTPSHALHPTDETLSAFGLGKLDDPTAESVADHLEGCPACRERVAAAPADSFLGRLREARERGSTPTPGKSLSGVARSIGTPIWPGPVQPPAAATLPPGLADHPDYEVVRELGRGGMGVVYLARNRLMDRPEVLKVMNKESVNRPGAADRFLREIRSAAQLNHPNVVRAYSAVRLGDALMFAMEYVEGDDLAGLVKARGPLPVLHACYYARQVALGLQHAHEHGMVHRDIKPANLMLARDGKKHTVKVLDFGLAKATSEGQADRGLTGKGMMMGTPDYMAPEQALDAARADIRADVYSLGCTLYHLLAGKPPFDGGGLYEVIHHHLETEAPLLNLVRPEVPPELAGVVAKMLAKDPGRRFQTPGEVALALVPFVKPVVPVAGRPAAPPPAPKPKSVAASTANNVWEDLTATSDPPVRARAAESRPSPGPRPRNARVWVWPVVAVGVLLAWLIAAWAGGLLKVKTKDGTIVIEGVPADAVVLVDGETVTVTRNGDEAKVTLNREGPHRLKVVQAGKELLSSDVTVTIGGEPVRLRVEKERIKPKKEDPPAWVFDPSGKTKPPDGDRLKKAKANVRRTYNAELASTKPEDRARLIKRLVERAGEERVDETDLRYALLDLAVEEASKAGDFATALETCNEILLC